MDKGAFAVPEGTFGRQGCGIGEPPLCGGGIRSFAHSNVSTWRIRPEGLFARSAETG